MRFALQRVKAGLCCEFGVYKGGSLAFFCDITDRTFHGFDSFRGLSEDWLDFKAGHLDLGGRPEKFPFPPDRVVIHEGLFEETIPKFLGEYVGPIVFAHIDCDLYSSTVTVLRHIKPRLQKKSILVFDEYVTGVDDERKALLESGISFQYLSRHCKGGSVAVRVA